MILMICFAAHPSNPRLVKLDRLQRSWSPHAPNVSKSGERLAVDDLYLMMQTDMIKVVLLADTLMKKLKKMMDCKLGSSYMWFGRHSHVAL